MANEISISIATQLANGELKDEVAYLTDQVNQTTKNMWANTIDVTTAEADVAPVGLTALGYCYIKNLDSTNFIKYGPKSGGAMVVLGKLKAGEHTVLRLMTGITLRWIADTATCKVLIRIYDD